MKVLLGIGGSEDSFAALEAAVDRARESGDDLTVAIVDNPESSPTVDDLRARVTGRLEDAGVDPDVRTLEGHPGSRLVEFAASEDFDRIVLGGGQRSPLGKVRLGSISEYVLLNARTTVTLVR